MFPYTFIKNIIRPSPRPEIKTVPAPTISLPIPFPSAIIVTPPDEPPAFDGIPVGNFPEFLQCLPLTREMPWKVLANQPPPLSAAASKRHGISGFSTIAATTTDVTNIAQYYEMMREDLWENAKGITPFSDGMYVFMPGSPTAIKEFMFGEKMRSWNMYNKMVRQIRDDSHRKSPEPIVLLSKTYPKAIYDPTSYHAWLEWVKGRDADDRVLMAV